MTPHEVALAASGEHNLFTFLDLAGTFAFAISGAVAARSRNLDWFGVIVVAYIVACGGGIIRDLCIGAVPPANLTNWIYLATSVVAAIMTIAADPLVDRISHPVTFFDSIGLGLFAVTGAQKAMMYGHNTEAAILLGVVTAVGGGVTRDILLTRVPIILQREIYASAALVAACIEVMGERLGWDSSWRTWFALAVCFWLRYMSLRYKWNLPRFKKSTDTDAEH